MYKKKSNYEIKKIIKHKSIPFSYFCKKKSMNIFKCTFILFFIAIVFTTVSCQNHKTNSSKSTLTIKNEANKPFLKIEKEFNFGKINKKETPKKEFTIEITNTGNTPLVIIKTDVTCGCMTVTYTKHPILKGEKGLIKLDINASKQEGYFNKPIIIKSNAQNDLEILRVKGHIQ